MASKPPVLPETFQGTESWEDWIEHFERVAAVNEWTSNASKLKWLKVRLTGKAAAALKRFPEATRNDYAALKEALQKRFEPASKKELYMAEFQIRLKRKDEDWASFGDSLRFLAEKSYPDLTSEAQEVLALNHYLTQLENPQVNFSVRHKQPTSIDQAVQYTLEVESYLHPHKQQMFAATVGTVPVTPLLTPSAPQQLTTEQHTTDEQLVAAVPNKSDPMLSIMKRLDALESQLKLATSSNKWERRNRPTQASESFQSHLSEQSTGQHRRTVVCFKCGQEGHFARGCAVRRKAEGGKQPVNAVTETVNNNNVDSQDAIPAVSQSVTTDYHLQGTIEGIPARFLVDTGATTSVLCKDVWTKIDRQTGCTLTEVAGKKLVGVEGSPLKVLGAANVHVVLEQQQFDVCFLVADSLTTEAILGRDFLRDNHCVIDVGRNLIKFDTAGLTLKLLCSPGDSQIAHVSVMVDSVLQVPGCSEMEIMAKVPSAAIGGTSIVESSPANSKAVMIARTLVTPTDQCVPVRLLNPQPEKITVNKGTTIARMEAVAVIAATSDPVMESKHQLFEDMVKQLGTHVSTAQRDQLLQLLLEFSDVFAASSNDLGRTDLIKHQIDTGNAHPIRQQI